MKKLFLVLISLLVFSGCKKDTENIISEVESKINSLENYNLKGEMVITNNEDKYNYKVDVAFKKGNYYKVSLINTDNQHEQIILKNSDGIYVVTPSLNKSFKFQSEWPTNSSQSYILETLLNDITDDSERSVKESNGNYEITVKANYPNNSDLTSETITFDKDYLPKKVVVKNTAGLTSITMNITSINTKIKYEEEYFKLSNTIKEDATTTEEETETTSTLDDIVYPMYIPSGTSYSGEELVTTSSSERVILTYTGVKPFILIEEASAKASSHETTNIDGEIVQYGNVIGILTETSLNWSDNGKEYYLIGENLEDSELLQIASSTAKVALVK